MASRYIFREEEIQELEEARKRNKNKRVEARLHAIELSAKGKTQKEIAAITGFHPAYMSQLVKKYRPEKNHGFLLQILRQALALQPNARLALLGDGDLMEQTKALADKLGIADKVLFVGNVPNANEWYQAFDVFVLPSHNEGLPVVGIEAQAAVIERRGQTDAIRAAGYDIAIEARKLEAIYLAMAASEGS